MAKRRKWFSVIKQVREFYGMTQSAFAKFIGISRALLSLAELDKRELPSKADQTVGRLLAAMTSSSSAREPAGEFKSIQKKQRDQRAMDAKKRVIDAQHAIKVAEKALAKLQADHRRAVGIMASFDILRNNGIKGDSELCTVLESDVEALYQKSGEDAQLPLEVRIEGMRAEIAYLNKKFKGEL